MNQMDIDIEHPLNKMLLLHMQTRTPDSMAVKPNDAGSDSHSPDRFPLTPAPLPFTQKPAVKAKRFSGLRFAFGNMFTRSKQ